MSERLGPGGDPVENRTGDEVLVMTLAAEWELRRYDENADGWVTIESWPVVIETLGGVDAT